MSLIPRVVSSFVLACSVCMTPARSLAQGVPEDDVPPQTARIDVDGELFARYAHETAGDEDVRVFSIPRARLGADVGLDDNFGGRILVETVPSSAPGSLYGVDGDSLVLRAREVYGEASSPPLIAGIVLTGRFGLVPTLAITPLERAWGRRVVAPSGVEAFGLSAPSDYGATFGVVLPWQLGDLTVGAFNGEGFNRREENSAKNVAARALLRPLATVLPPQPGAEGLGLLLVVEDGAVGPTRSRADRYVGGLSFEHRWAAAGVEAAMAHGVFGNGAQRARTYGGWLRVGPAWGAEVLARYEVFDPDYETSGAKDQVTAWRAGAGWHAPFAPGAEEAFEIYATYGRVAGGELAEGADPSLPLAGMRIDLRMGF